MKYLASCLSANQGNPSESAMPAVAIKKDDEADNEPKEDQASLKKKMYSFILYSVKRRINVAMKTKCTMPKECATTAITNTDEQRSHGTALTINFTLRECVKTVTSTTTTVRNGQKSRAKSRVTRRKTLRACRKVLND